MLQEDGEQVATSLFPDATSTPPHHSQPCDDRILQAQGVNAEPATVQVFGKHNPYHGWRDGIV